MTKLSAKRKSGNGAREALIKALANAGVTVTATIAVADSVLTDLYVDGFLVAPIPGTPPARRGNVIKPDVWIGKSHTAKLCGH